MLVHQPPHFDQFAPALSVFSALRGTRVTVLTADFDDHVVAEQEIDASNEPSSVSVDDLSCRARQTCFADDA